MMQPSSSDISSQTKKRKTTLQFAASDLKVDDRLGDVVAPNCHFKLFEVIAGDEAKWLEEAVDKLFTLPNKTPRIPYQVGSHLYTHVAQCIAAISYKSRNLLGAVDDFDMYSDHGRVTSETELRYSVIDPILEMICNCWGYKIKLEERVKRTNRLTATTPGTMAAKNVSDTSRADYSIYSIAAGGPVLAVILEAKTTQHPKFTHALGQVIGYCIKFLTDVSAPPLCSIVSEKSVQIVLFPYSTPHGDPAVDCLVVPVLDLYDVEVDVNFANQHVLALILLLSNLGVNLNKRLAQISLPSATKMSVVQDVQIKSQQEITDQLLAQQQEVADRLLEEQKKITDQLEARLDAALKQLHQYQN